MLYNFKFDILQGGIGNSVGQITLDLTETEMLFVYAAYETKDPTFCLKALKSVEKKAHAAIEKVFSNTYTPGPKLKGIPIMNEDLPEELIMDAMDNPLSDALIHYIKNMEQVESLVFYDGVRQYCDKIIKTIE